MSNINSATQKLLQSLEQLALKLVQMKMLGKTMMRKIIFRMKKLMNKSQAVVKNQSLLMKAYFSDFYHPHAHVDNHDCLKKNSLFYFLISSVFFNQSQKHILLLFRIIFTKSE